ncbi:MAG TPA: carbohydrate kinase [Devosia sp.]|jgi:fructokinase|uniref:carbohydrate kinase family protein n=1 Tax=Devosia sp. TaxID=1871048 RepID=UPI002F95C763
MIVVAGESLVDLVPAATGGIKAMPGGSPFNCGIALAKLGNPVGFLCRISDDPYGDVLLRTMGEAGLQPLLSERSSDATTTATVAFDANLQPHYSFRRGADRPPAAKILIPALPPQVDLLHVGGFAPLTEQDADSWMPVIEHAAALGAPISIDINVRDSLIEDETGYRSRLSRMIGLANLVKLSEEDLAWLEPEQPPEEYARKLLRNENCKLVVVTLGHRGSLAFTRTTSAAAGVHAPEVFGDTVGAGDSLMAGVVASLRRFDALTPRAMSELETTELESMLEFAAVVAGLNCAHHGCRPPTLSQVEAILASA